MYSILVVLNLPIRQNPPPSNMVTYKDNNNNNNNNTTDDDEEVENTTIVTCLDDVSVDTGITTIDNATTNKLSNSHSQPRSRSRSTSQAKRDAEPTSTSTFQLALPPPKLHKPEVLRMSSLLILQIQQLSLLARRPVPVLEVRRPSILAPVRLSRDFSKRARLTSSDCYITQIEPYMSIPCLSSGRIPRDSLSEEEEEEEEDNDDGHKEEGRQNQYYHRHPIVAAIETSKKNNDHQGIIYLRYGRIWKATTLSEGIYRFKIADGAGSHIMIQLEKLSPQKPYQQQQQSKKKHRRSSQASSNKPPATPSTCDGPDETATFGVRIVHQEVKGSVLIGTISRYNIELYLDRALRNVYDEFWTCLVPPVVLDPKAESYCRRSEKEGWEGRLYTLIGAFGVWMALREGWTV